MKITNSKGKDITLPIVNRPGDDSAPIALVDGHTVVFAIFAIFVGEWAHALDGNDWVTPATHDILALSSEGQNPDAPRWRVPSWQAVPKGAAAAFAAQVAAADAAAAIRAAAEMERLAGYAEIDRLKGIIDTALEAGGTPTHYTFRATLGDADHAEAWGYDFASVASHEIRSARHADAFAATCRSSGTPMTEAGCLDFAAAQVAAYAALARAS